MAQLGQLGDLSGAQVSNGFEPVPAGSYRAQVIETELRQTKAGNGQYIRATFEILDGPHAGKKIFTNYNIAHSNPQTQEIGRGQLKAFLTYSGHPNPNMLRNTEEMHGRPVIINVIVKAGSGEYGPSNEIKSYAAVGAGAAKPAAAAGFAAPKPPAAAAAPAATAAPPSAAAPAASADDDIPPFEQATAVSPTDAAALKAAAGF